MPEEGEFSSPGPALFLQKRCEKTEGHLTGTGKCHTMKDKYPKTTGYSVHTGAARPFSHK